MIVMARQDVETMISEAFALLHPERQMASDVVKVPLIIEKNDARLARVLN